MPTKVLKFSLVFVFLFGVQAMAIEEAKYSLVEKEGDFEVRDYKPFLLAEVVVEGDFEDVGSMAFRYLFEYISGENQSKADIAMTAPVSQQSAGETIAMTAPVSQSGSNGRYVVSFMMPASYTLETIPQPVNQRVTIRQVAAHRMAVVIYSGTWSQDNYQENKQKLDRWIEGKDFKVIGDPVWSRFNAPFSLWFLRRNEIQVPIAAA